MLDKEQKKLLEQSGLVELQSIIPDIALDLRYATTNNFTGVKLYSTPSCFLLKPVALQLARVQADLKKDNLSLKIWDAYRPESSQKILKKYCSDTDYVAAVSNHSRGITVDLILINTDGEEIEMPTKFDSFSEKAHSNYADLSKKALANREKLKQAMSKHGFTVHPNEWWHYDYLPLKESQVLDISL